LTHVKNESNVTLISLARAKKEPGTPTPPSLKKALRLTEDAALHLEYQALDDPEEFPSLRATELTSFNKVQPGTLDFVLAWSRQDAKKDDAEWVLRLGLCVNLDEDDEDNADPSSDSGEGCSTWASKDKPSSDDGNDGGANYDVFYQHLDMN
jgi:hypothetical protein